MKLIGKNVFVVDIECDGLLDQLTKLHVLSAAYQNDSGAWTLLHTDDPERIQNLIGNPDNVLIGHNFIDFDKRALEKLGYTFNAQVIDTLGLSWYLFSDRGRHGLESWGEDFGVPKPEIEDWENLSFEEYAHRCDEDVKINLQLWIKIYNLLVQLYDGNLEEMVKVIKLCNFLLDVLVIQNENPIHLNKNLAEENLAKIEAIIEEKSNALKEVMPKVPKMAKRKKPNNIYKKPATPPSKMFNKKGDLTAAGEKWRVLLEEKGLPEDHIEPIPLLSAAGEKWMNLLKRTDPPLPDDYDGEIMEVTKMEDPNPSSVPQVKSWLLSLGWQPRIYSDGAEGPNTVPQLRDQDKNLCPSVLELIKTAPAVEHLEGLSVAQHRRGVLQGFIDSIREDGTVVASASKFTRTFRFAHKKPIVNIPSNTSTHGELIRICLESPKGFDWVNADLDALEDRCKQIQVAPWASHEYLHKPDDYDPHIEVSVAAGLMSETEAEFFKWFKAETHDLSTCPEPFNQMSVVQRKDEYTRLGDVRKKGKIANYSCLPVDITEVLTKEGWKYYKDLKEGDLVLSYNDESGYTEFVPIQKIHFYENVGTTFMHNSHWGIESTPDHRWLGYQRRQKGDKRYQELCYKQTSEINTEFNILNAAEYSGGEWNISEDESSFLGWLLADGYFKWSNKEPITSSSFGTKRHIKTSISQSKKKYYKEVKSLLDRLEVKYHEYTNNSNVECFDIKPQWMRELFTKLEIEQEDKHYVDWPRHILKMSPGCLSSFLDAFFKADGTMQRDRMVIAQNTGKILDAVELCCNLLGYRTTRLLKEKTSSGRLHYVLNISKRGTTTGQKLKKDFMRKTDVFCLTVPNSNFVVRQIKGVVTITGNCIYGVGAPKLSKTLNTTQKEAKKIINAYWEIHKPVKDYSATLETKKVDDRDWVYNPFTKLWLHYRGDHNLFSACTQNFGAIVHARLMFFYIQNGIKPIANIHDEVSWYWPEDDKETCKSIVSSCVETLNNSFGFDIRFDAEPEFANSYGEVH